MKFQTFALMALLVALPAAAQLPDADRLAHIADQAARTSFNTFHELLSIPNDAHYPGHVERNVAWMRRAFEQRDFKITVLDTGGPPILLAERGAPSPRAPTVLIYLQIDGQPVDSTQWFQDSPYDPVLKAQAPDGSWGQIPWSSLEGGYDPDWRVFARSASDAKGPVAMFLAALDRRR